MKHLVTLVTLTVLAACSSGTDDREETVGKEIARDYNRQMQKAADVELQLDDKRRRMDEALEASDPAARQPD